MNTLTTQIVIANHLSVALEAIKEVQEWASVLWVRFTGGCRFVSKKVKDMAQQKYVVLREYQHGHYKGQPDRPFVERNLLMFRHQGKQQDVYGDVSDMSNVLVFDSVEEAENHIASDNRPSTARQAEYSVIPFEQGEAIMTEKYEYFCNGIVNFAEKTKQLYSR